MRKWSQISRLRTGSVTGSANADSNPLQPRREREGYAVSYLETAALPTSADVVTHLSKDAIKEIHLCDPLEHDLTAPI